MPTRIGHRASRLPRPRRIARTGWLGTVGSSRARSRSLARSARLTRLPRPATTAATACARGLRGILSYLEDEQPLVVLLCFTNGFQERGLPLVRNPYRLLLARTGYPDDTAQCLTGHATPDEPSRLAEPPRCPKSAVGSLPGELRTGSHETPELLGVLPENAPLALLGHRILVGLAQELLLHQNVQVGWKGSRVFPLVSLDGLDVLPAPPEKLFFPVPLDHVVPNGDRGRHEDAHDDQPDGDAEEDVTFV